MKYPPFEATSYIRIPDSTLLSPFLNPKDLVSELPFDLFDGFSLAKGKIENKTKSIIHIHLYVDLVIYVISGKIELKMKGELNKIPYVLPLTPNQAGICKRREFLQLHNPFNEICHVLYIVSPAYLFDIEGDKVIYDDAIILDYTWDELGIVNWEPKEIRAKVNSKKSRDEAYLRLKEKKSRITRSNTNYPINH